MRNVLVAGLVVGAVIAFAPRSEATTITFDDINTPFIDATIPNGYQGLNWDNFAVLNNLSLMKFDGNNGYTNNVVSEPNVAYNISGTPVAISGGKFTVNSFYFGSAWNNGLSVTIIGLLNGVPLDSTTFTVNATGPAVLETLNWSGINELDFSSAGGVPAGYAGVGTQFVLDDLTINAVPAPSIGRGLPTLLAVGGLLLGAKLLKRGKGRRLQFG